MELEDILAPRLAGLGTTIFSEINRIAARHEAINLGQGAPDFDGPEFLKEAAIRAIRDGQNQYAPGIGVAALRDAIAHHQDRFYGLEYDPAEEVTVFTGATEAIYAAIVSLVGPGDEVVMFEPFYDSYLASVKMAGAEARAVTLHSPDFGFDPEELERAITPATRLLLLNTPHNPSGRVLTRAELEQIAELCRRHNLICISDEVYEHLVFDGEHVPIATLPGMFERTVTLSSTGKTFSLTGWKIGYACAPPALSTALRTAHQFITFCQATPLQVAMAEALTAEDSYFESFVASYRDKRDRLVRGLTEVGLDIAAPEGTYFVLADIRPLGWTDDREFCRVLPERVGVAAIPASAFYVHPERGRHLARFAFCKRDAILDQAVERLKGLAQ